MQLEILRSIDAKDAPTLAPDDRPIDLVHLSRTTMGDPSLEREVLRLFDRQSTLLIARARGAATPPLRTRARGAGRGAGRGRPPRRGAGTGRLCRPGCGCRCARPS